MTQKRITVEAAREAYEATGMEPKRGVYFYIRDEIVKCCPESAVYIHTTGADPRDDSVIDVIDWEKEVYGDYYAAGFRQGFDDGRLLNPESDDYSCGHSDGQAVAAALLPREVSHAG